MKKLRISADLALPAHEAQTQTFVVYGGKGMGKTNFGAVLAEELAAAALRFAWFDPVGVAWGLKHSADGRGEGIGVLTLGGAHGGIPIHPTAGAVVADLVVDEDVSVIVDVSRHANGQLWTNGEKIRFARDYFIRLYQRQGERKRPLMQIVDEAGRFVPQDLPRGAVDIMECVGAIEQLVELGRNVGVGVALITQRSARMRKSVSELAEAMLAFRTVGPRSLAAIEDWFEEHIERKHALELRNRIRELPRGTAMIVSPGWLGVEGEYQIRARTTFDSSATPVAGKERRPSGKGARVDLAHYAERMAETIEQAKADDPRELQRRLRDAEKRAHDLANEVQVLRAQEPEPASDTEELERLRAEISKRDDIVDELDEKIAETIALEGHRKLLCLVLDELTDLDERAMAAMSALRDGEAAVLAPRRQRVETFEPPAPPPPRPRAEQTGTERVRGAVQPSTPGGSVEAVASAPARPPAPPAAVGDVDDERLTGPQQTLLDKLRVLETMRITAPKRSVLAALAGVSANGSGFEKNIGRLRVLGLVVYPSSGLVSLTATGRARGAEPDRPATEAELQEGFVRMLTGPQGDLLRILIADAPHALTREELAARAGVSVEGSGFEKNVGRLRSFGLAEYPQPGEVRALPILFFQGGV